MNVVFVGTSDFAVPLLEKVRATGQEIGLVITRPDRRSGRGQKRVPTPVKTAAMKLGLATLQPETIGTGCVIDEIKRTGASLGVVAAYGEILKAEVLSALPRGFLNVHASLLPAYRGAAPVNWAIINGETETGVTIIRMTPAMDAGPILTQEKTPIGRDETAGQLHERLSHLAGALLTDLLRAIDQGREPEERLQDESAVSYAPRLSKRDGRIEWQLPAGELRDRVRGLTPWPGAFSWWEGNRGRMRIALLEVAAEAQEAATEEAQPGTVLAVDRRKGITVQTGDGQVVIKRLKPASGKAMESSAFLRGHTVRPGDILC